MTAIVLISLAIVIIFTVSGNILCCVLRPDTCNVLYILQRDPHFPEIFVFIIIYIRSQSGFFFVLLSIVFIFTFFAGSCNDTCNVLHVLHRDHHFPEIFVFISIRFQWGFYFGFLSI